MITEFSILGLHGERNVVIKFDKPYKIIVAENGFGKTSILNAFYALIIGDLAKLIKIDFEQISISFENKISVTLLKNEISVGIDEFISQNPIFKHLQIALGESNFRQFINEVIFLGDIEKIEFNEFVNRYSKYQNQSFDTGLLHHLFYILRDQGQLRLLLSKEIANKIKIIKESFNKSIIYLPTYRRVEEDIKNLYRGKSDINLDEFSLNFGMSDVKQSIQGITSEISTSSTKWFSKINGEMLSQLINGINITNTMREDISNPKSVEIVLKRIGNNLSDNDKGKILELVKSEEIFNDNYQPLLYFVANLLKVYEQQLENDEAIQSFTNVCNRYLRDKEVIYDESLVKLIIQRKKNKKEVSIDSLSSGEKQIISLFSSLYLNRRNDVAIFFDEPELSLSIEWQKTLLPDIINSNKCSFLFCTTHSPFIFENELIKNTSDLSEYIEEL